MVERRHTTSDCQSPPARDQFAELVPPLVPLLLRVAAVLDLRQALEGLPQRLRMIVALRYFADMDATEIGLVLRMPSATVRSHLRRTLLILRSALRTAEELPSAQTPVKGETVC